MCADAVRPFDPDLDEFLPPGYDWRRRLAVLVVGSVGCLGFLALVPNQTTPPLGSSSSGRVANPPPLTTSTTVSPQSIQAGVASLLSHDGPTPQELASAPASARAAGVRHVHSAARSHVRG